MRYESAIALSLLMQAWIALAAVAAPPVDYQRDIKPLLLYKCAACHGALQQTSGLRLDAGVLIRAGGDSGPAIQIGDGAASLLVQRVAATDADLRMPPEGEGERLTPAQVQMLSRWIDQGAASPADEKIPADPAEYWSYKPPRSARVPAAAHALWARNPLDAFIAAKHQELDLVPRADAPRQVWLRRVFLDLIGIPPTREESQAFLADDSAIAYEKIVDALLQRPEYGQRWGRHWMDVWRYSDWYGSRSINEIRYSQRHIWRWRDWIVESLLDDKPYDQMLVEMLAGDELAPCDPNVLRATGFLGRNWYKFDRNVWLFDTVEHTSQAFLGLTLRCARCHDHKFDPISQQDYYRFRAFFEPYSVRTDPLTADAPQQKDATLGMVSQDGLARVFDKELDVKTFLFQRGDDRSPEESRPLSPGVPAALGNSQIDVRPIPLPLQAYYPSLRPEFAEGLIALAESEVRTAQQQFASARGELTVARQALAEFQARIDDSESPVADPSTAVFSDDFSSQSDRWKIVSGNWAWDNGKLTESSVSSFATIVAEVDHPRDFRARVKYRTLQPGTYRSVGFSFDYLDQGNSQDVYTSVNDSAPSIQAFHRQDGKQEYPQSGIVKTSLATGEVFLVEVTAKGQRLTVSLNGEHQFDYVMPVARRPGKFALWVHYGAAEFLQVDIQPLLSTLRDFQRQQQAAADQAVLAQCQLRIARAEVAGVRARVAAERAKYHGQSDPVVHQAAIQASRAERQVAVVKTEQAVLQAEQHLSKLLAAEASALEQRAITAPGESSGRASQSSPSAGQLEAETKLAEAQQALTAAQTAAGSPDGNYVPLGEIFPATSTGRRLALARWITSAENPRTARVAVNHIWLRHFGQALVPTVANFGLNGQNPSHPELLDWLAVKLIDGGWRMKPLHRLIVLSATYRQSSAVGDVSASQSRDPENRFLWRMNSRRMEAEVVRDSLLFTAGMLDLSHGGPEIAEGEGQTVPRRSLYFRNTPNEKMPFLDTFDGPNPNECYRRQESVVPHQALALLNSALALDQSRTLAEQLSDSLGDENDGPGQTRFITAAWQTILSRSPTQQELAACHAFLQENAALVQSTGQAVFPDGGQTVRHPASSLPHQRARENLIHVLYSHNDFVTIR